MSPAIPVKWWIPSDPAQDANSLYAEAGDVSAVRMCARPLSNEVDVWIAHLCVRWRRIRKGTFQQTEPQLPTGHGRAAAMPTAASAHVYPCTAIGVTRPSRAQAMLRVRTRVDLPGAVTPVDLLPLLPNRRTASRGLNEHRLVVLSHRFESP